MIETLSTDAASATHATSSDLNVRVSRFGAWYHFDIRHEDQRKWSEEISTQAERSIAGVMATIAVGYNASAKTDVPVLFVSSMWPEAVIARNDIVDMSDVYADVYEAIPDSTTGLQYAVYATKNVAGLAYLIEMFGVFGMVFPLGVQANLWLQIGMNSWDFVLNDRAAERIPDLVLHAFSEEHLELIPTSPEPAINRKAHAEKTVMDFTRPRPVRFKR